MSRPPLPQGQVREVTLSTRIRPATVVRMDALRQARGISRAEVVREALGNWIAIEEEKR